MTKTRNDDLLRVAIAVGKKQAPTDPFWRRLQTAFYRRKVADAQRSLTESRRALARLNETTSDAVAADGPDLDDAVAVDGRAFFVD